MRTTIGFLLVLSGCGPATVCAGPADRDCDGTVDAAEATPCHDCTVLCSEAGWSCYRNGVLVPSSEHHGFRCSDSESIEDHRGIVIDCSAGPGVEAPCIRDGSPVVGDLPFAQCLE